jgi:flagellar M-ring protein FliF
MAIKDLNDQLKDIYSKLTLLQKVSISTAVVAVVASMIVVIMWANRPVYKTLFANLKSDDASVVVEKLKEKNIPYKLIGGGKAITVPQEMVYETRLELTREGVPKGGGAGFELFDKTSYGMTEFLQNVSYQRALQGELSRTISALSNISEARVHLTVPKDRLFIGEGDTAKAAVVLKLRGGSLGRGEVKSIASLVAGSVKGLTIENVQIVDTNGTLLSDFLSNENEPAMMTSTQLEYKTRVEKNLEKKANEMLARTLGPRNAIAKVSVDMDFAKREIMKEEFGNEPVLRSSQTLEISSKNSPEAPSGVPGVQSNLAEPELGAGNTNSEYNKAEETTNFEISKTVTKEQSAFGGIKRITVAVVVDDKKSKKIENEEETIVATPRTEEELNRIKSLVAMAVGINDKRGDQIEISNISFDTTAQEQEQLDVKRDKMIELISMGVKYLAAGIILFLFYFLVIRKILKRMDKTVVVHDDGSVTVSPKEKPKGDLDVTIGDESAFPKSLEELEHEIENELAESAPVDVESVKSKVMLKKIEEYANEDPEATANLIKSLLKGGG